MTYMIWKNGQCIESGMQKLKLDYLKQRTKSLNANVLHVISGEVVDIYHNKNNRMVFSHTFIKEV